MATKVARRSAEAWSSCRGVQLSSSRSCSSKLQAKAMQVASPHRLQFVWGSNLQVSRGHGAYFIAVTTTNPPEALTQADIVVNTLEQLTKEQVNSLV